MFFNDLINSRNDEVKLSLLPRPREEYVSVT